MTARRDYNKHVQRKLRESYKKLWLEILYSERDSVECSKCGIDEFPVLDFHHIDPLEKAFKISLYLGKKPTPKRIKQFIAELNKCIILCANCHRRLHYSSPC